MKKSVIIYSHIIFWIIIISSIFIEPFLTRYLSAKEYMSYIPYLKLLAPLYFYIGYIGIMKIYKKKGFVLYTSLIVISSYLILFFISKKAFAFGISPLSSMLLWTTIGCLFKFFIDWFQKRNDIILLEKENSESKLAALRTQINPHFLFNTLHNIDTLIYDNQKKASKSLEKLSDIMRYMLRDSNYETIEIERELEHLNNYISLERLRFKNENFLNLRISNEITDIKIAPMLFIPFIENAFKHSVDSDIENGISIEMKKENRILKFVCKNQFDKSEKDKDKVHGIGLNTVKKRLDLIYKNRYKLSVDSDNSEYIVNLEIELNEN